MRTIRQRSYLRSFLVFAVAISSISSVGAPDDLLSKEGLDNWLCTALSTPDLENRLATLPSTDSEQVESTLLQGKFVDMQTWRVRSASVNIEYIKYTTKSTGKWHWVLAIRFREPIFASEQDIRAWLGSLAQSSIRKSQGDNPPYVEYIAGDPSPIRKAGHGEDYQRRFHVVIDGKGETTIKLVADGSDFPGLAKRFCSLQRPRDN